MGYSSNYIYIYSLQNYKPYLLSKERERQEMVRKKKRGGGEKEINRGKKVHMNFRVFSIKCSETKRPTQ